MPAFASATCESSSRYPEGDYHWLCCCLEGVGVKLIFRVTQHIRDESLTNSELCEKFCSIRYDEQLMLCMERRWWTLYDGSWLKMMRRWWRKEKSYLATKQASAITCHQEVNGTARGRSTGYKDLYTALKSRQHLPPLFSISILAHQPDIFM